MIKSKSHAKVITAAITPYSPSASEQISIDAQGNLRVALVSAAGGSAGQLSSTTQNPVIAAAPAGWRILHAPVANTQATITLAAGGAGIRHIATALVANICSFAAETSPLSIVVRDGAAGAGTIIFQARVSSAILVAVSGLTLLGTANTAMTIEFTTAPTNALNFETVWMQGYSVALA